jgi:hypothetical protein
MSVPSSKLPDEVPDVLAGLLVQDLGATEGDRHE